ncbi:hypothetical protein ACFU9K_42745, partial [Streptomyces sp. NPDC057582]
RARLSTVHGTARHPSAISTPQLTCHTRNLTRPVCWIPVFQARAAVPVAGAGHAPAEGHFPVSVVAGHGLAAVTTVVLVLLTALGIGG